MANSQNKNYFNTEKEQANKQNEMIEYIKLGHVYKENNQIQTAVEYYKKALEIAREQEDKENETRVYIWLGYAYILNNQYQTAI